MNTIELHSNGSKHTFTGPSSWDEITDARQYTRLVRLAHLGEFIPSTRFAVLRVIYGKKAHLFKSLFASKDFSVVADSPYTVADKSALLGQQLLQTIDWLWQDTPQHRWYFPTLRVLHKRFVGPGDNLTDMTFGQFMMAESHFTQLHDDADNYKLHIKNLVATLLLDKGKTFAQVNTDRNLRYIGWLRPKTHEAILHNYTGLRSTLVKSFPEIFQPASDKKKQAQKKSKTSGWLEIALSLAGDDLIKFHAYENDNLWLVLKVIQNAIIRSNEMDRLAQKRK